jgi:hypothetical protein
MINIIVYAVIAWFVFSIILAYFEIKNAPIIDEKEPFLHGDYDPLIEHHNKYCVNCAFLDNDGKCLHRYNVRNVDTQAIENCIKESMFKAK